MMTKRWNLILEDLACCLFWVSASSHLHVQAWQRVNTPENYGNNKVKVLKTYIETKLASEPDDKK